MPWILAGLAGVLLALAALAAGGRLGEMPEPPVEDEWIEPPGPDGDTPAGDPPDLSLPDTR